MGTEGEEKVDLDMRLCDSKSVKPKRTLSESQLAKLKLAREKALKVKAEMKKSSDDEKIKHYESKIQRIKSHSTKHVPSQANEPNEEPKMMEEISQSLEDDVVAQDEEKPIKVVKKPKAKAKQKPVIIYEQSEESESEEEENVIYIKRKSSKSSKKQEPQLTQHYEPPPIRREVLMNPNPFYRHNLMHNYM